MPLDCASVVERRLPFAGSFTGRQDVLSWEYWGDNDDVLFCYSPDGGTTFTAPVNPSDRPSHDWENKSTVTANDRGRVFIAWGGGLGGSHYDIYSASGALSSIEESQAQSLSIVTCEVSPNPSRGSVSLTYFSRRAGTTRVEILDLAGRLIVPLGSNLENPGRHVKMWSGRNSDGKRVRTGIYFIRAGNAGWQFLREGPVCE